MKNKKEQVFKIRNFSYNGFMGELLKGITPYTATFIKWTLDPGIGVFQCSDGKKRLIPTFAIVDWCGKFIPKQDMSKGVMFGAASHS